MRTRSLLPLLLVLLPLALASCGDPSLNTGIVEGRAKHDATSATPANYDLFVSSDKDHLTRVVWVSYTTYMNCPVGAHYDANLSRCDP